MKTTVHSGTYEILGLHLKSPLIVGSGLLSDQPRNIRQLLAHGAAAVVTKTIFPDCQKTHAEQIHVIETGLLNNTTYSKRSVADWLVVLSEFRRDGLPVIASIHARTAEALGELAAQVAQVSDCPLELGISCLHADDVDDDTPERVEAYARAVRGRTTAPFSVKLALGPGLIERARSAQRAGAQAITLSDSLSGLAFDEQGQRVMLGGVCGYSGSGIKPLVLAAIHDLRRQGFELPIMGCGGVGRGRDVHEYLMVGAQTVQVYSALHQDMFGTLQSICSEFAERCETSRREVTA
ncbi:dihydroorotate dehydrogenase [Pseudomonas sp. S75]|uniref:hypothetical protein n=1 Tax=unclassified Pseudomonas TaxID=196821 RepID=UPI0019060271|nr:MULTISPECIES: hypothetical protein [unclassified Pseudomonas]MBJ9975369.1 dihydroorotate dehydrogenase [Pseudomonas sp. S30]MBK0152657.1 dihydroorotate dehydrogenase [Pseudomonas sp. S75]